MLGGAIARSRCGARARGVIIGKLTIWPDLAGARPVTKRVSRRRRPGQARVLLSGGSMNAIFFAAKRVFHGALRVSRPQLQSVARGLTSARFDMMYALTTPVRGPLKFERYETRQSDLRKTLGVTATVVSRMLRSLEVLGWVTRRRSSAGDRRQLHVTLTEAGLSCIRTAYKMLFRFAERVVYHAICWGKHRDPNERFLHMDRLESYLRSLRAYCRDRARLYYAWGHPDD
jgi:DNA-binding MarR family transcriptional regulator